MTDFLCCINNYVEYFMDKPYFCVSSWNNKPFLSLMLTALCMCF